MGMTHRKRKPTRPTKARPPRPLFPFAVTLRACALIFEGNGSPALYICADDGRGLPQVRRVPDGAQVTVNAPRPSPEDRGRVFLPAGSTVNFQAPDGRTSTLALHTVRLCREVLEALEGHAQATRAAQEARAAFEGTPGEEETPAQGQGAA
ncbi:hypothetical protein AMD26_018355 [Deinococcus sp. UR1]|nr:hypothetical protein AMD26_018355 [Deinococcus sp. UR1]